MALVSDQTAAFSQRAAAAREKFGPLVFGLDPSGSLLESWGFGDTPTGLEHFVDTVLEAASGTVGFVKPQSAFYERHGWKGVRALQRLVAACRSAGLLAIVDAKRGDIGSTNDAYAEAYLSPGAPIAADALTVHPYLGLAAMGSLLDHAVASASCLFVVTRSSNPEGRQLQTARRADGMSVEAGLLDEIGSLNWRLAPDRIGPVGAVVALTGEGEPLDLEPAHALLLAPGLGAQGATASDVARLAPSCPERVLPSASRAILSAGPDPGSLRERALELAAGVREALGA